MTLLYNYLLVTILISEKSGKYKISFCFADLLKRRNKDE